MLGNLNEFFVSIFYRLLFFSDKLIELFQKVTVGGQEVGRAIVISIAANQVEGLSLEKLSLLFDFEVGNFSFNLVDCFNVTVHLARDEEPVPVL